MVMGAVNIEVLKTSLKAITEMYQAGMDLEDGFQVFIT